MAEITTEAAEVFRDYASDGVPASGAHEPIKADIRSLFQTIDARINLAGETGAYIVKSTLAALEADLDHAAGVYALVVADTSSPPANGYYVKVGASGTGSWSYVGPDRIGDEAVSRASADTSLTTRLSTEEAARAAADVSLTSRLSSEEVGRASVDVSIAAVADAADELAAEVDARLIGISTDGIFEDYVGAPTPGAGNTTFPSAGTFIFAAPLLRDGLAYGLEITTAGATTVKVKRFTRSVNTLTYQSEVSVSAPSGASVIGPDVFTALEVSAGDYIALYAPAGTLRYTSGAGTVPYYFTASDVTTTYTISTFPTTSNKPEAKILVYGRAADLNDTHLLAAKFDAITSERGGTVVLGAAMVADSALTISTGSTFFSRERNPEPGIVLEAKFYSKISGSAFLTIAKPSAAGFTLHYKTLVFYSAGENIYSIAAGNLALVDIPRGCIFGLFSNNASAITYTDGTTKAGYYSVSGEVTGDLGVMSQSFGREIQLQVTVVSPDQIRKIEAATPQYPVDINIGLAGAIPSNAKRAGVSYSSGYAESTTTGLTSAYVESFISSNNHRSRSRATIQLRSADARVAVYRRPILGLSGVDAGTLAEVDIANNRIILYQTWGGGSGVPTARDTLVLTTITLAEDVDYACELTNDKKQISFTITDTVSGLSETLDVDSDAVAAAAGFCYGAAGVGVIAGTGAVSRIIWQPMVRNPRLAIVGDSITEGSGTTQANAWANLVMDAMGGSALVSADGGTTSSAALRRTYEILHTTPSLEYLLVLIGTNDATGGASGVTDWQTHLPLLRAACLAFGVTPIVAHVIPRNDANQTHVDTMNAYIRSEGWRTVRFDLALSVGNDGSTYNAALMADSLHPNTAGHLAMKNRVLLDVPELFDA